MPNKTTNYQLNQWNPEDDFLRTDFNEDNTNLESALTSLQSSITSLQSSLSSTENSLSTAISNVKPVTGSYTGLYKSSVTTTTAINLGFKPSLVVIIPNNGVLSTSIGYQFAVAVSGLTSVPVKFTSTGFTVANGTYCCLNYLDVKYHYIAYR